MCASYNPNIDEDHEVYKLNPKTPGLVFIFNNKFFKTNTPRNGSEKDVEYLFEVFEALDFKVEIHLDETANEIRKSIKEITKETDYTDVGCVLVFIMSHGDNESGSDYIFGKDDLKVYLTDFIEPFKTVKSLKNKPKMFFVQACRGKGYVPVDSTDNDGKEFNNPIPQIALDADFLFAFATVVNYFGVRDSTNGSWFIQTLCSMIEKYKSTAHICDILTIVNKKVGEKEAWDNQNNCLIKMVPTYTSQLRGFFYFSKKIKNVKFLFNFCPFFLLNFICIERNSLIKKKVKQNEQVNDLASNFSKILPKTIEPNYYFSRKIVKCYFVFCSFKKKRN